MAKTQQEHVISKVGAGFVELTSAFEEPTIVFHYVSVGRRAFSRVVIFSRHVADLCEDVEQHGTWTAVHLKDGSRVTLGIDVGTIAGALQQAQQNALAQNYEILLQRQKSVPVPVQEPPKETWSLKGYLGRLFSRSAPTSGVADVMPPSKAKFGELSDPPVSYPKRETRPQPQRVEGSNLWGHNADVLREYLKQRGLLKADQPDDDLHSEPASESGPEEEQAAEPAVPRAQETQVQEKSASATTLRTTETLASLLQSSPSKPTTTRERLRARASRRAQPPPFVAATFPQLSKEKIEELVRFIEGGSHKKKKKAEPATEAPQLESTATYLDMNSDSEEAEETAAEAKRVERKRTGLPDSFKISAGELDTFVPVRHSRGRQRRSSVPPGHSEPAPPAETTPTAAPTQNRRVVSYAPSDRSLRTKEEIERIIQIEHERRQQIQREKSKPCGGVVKQLGGVASTKGWASVELPQPQPQQQASSSSDWPGLVAHGSDSPRQVVPEPSAPKPTGKPVEKRAARKEKEKEKPKPVPLAEWQGT